MDVLDPDEDVGFEDLIEIAELTEQYDIVCAIEKLRDAEQSDEDVDEEEITLPFYEDDRELAFALGVASGAVLSELENSDEEDEHRLADAEPAQQGEREVE